MLARILKWTGIALLCLVVMFVIAYSIFTFLFNRQQNTRYAIQLREIPIPTDAAAIAAGEHLFTIKGCSDCHDKNLAGKTFLDDPLIGYFAGANLTTGKGGLRPGYSTRDWLLALRHGVSHEGKSLLLMPSYEYARLSDQDIAAIIAFCKAQPPVDRELPRTHAGPVGRVLTVLGKMPLFPAQKVDHRFRQPAVMAPAATKEYGAYLSVSCTGCHNPHLTGGESPIPGGKRVADITSRGNLGKWTESGFISTLRTGRTPEGKQLENKDMPWSMTSQYTDEELKALFRYLSSL
ncbi:c-type cytochrome [Chitinophaga solisilvae]|uniref:c-type cytochrome n=1 Tax=Chitinophaga solisilvae TaxID=1233460 RepID=UPI00136EDB2D|nr:c-type cytochrome [Chitinophaga solisilvae]